MKTDPASEEVWKDVVGYEGFYQVSSFGQVRSLDIIQTRSNGKCICDRNLKGRILRQFRTKKGYMIVRLAGKTHRVHRLVAKAFIDNPLSKPEVNHKDGKKHKNHYLNLEWSTPTENIHHALENKLMATGSKVSTSKLTEDDVRYIRRVYIKGHHEFGAKPLARKYKVANTTLRNIVNNKKWRWID